MSFFSFRKLILKFQGMSRRERQAVLFTVLIVVGFALVVIGLLAILGPTQFRTFESKKDALRIDYPKLWTVRTDIKDVVVAFVSPQESEIDVFRENVTVIVQDLSSNPQSLKKYAQIAEIQIRAVFRDKIAVEFSGPTLVAGMTGHRFVYKGVDPAYGDLNIKLEHVFCMKGNKAYQLTYSSIVPKFDRYHRIFQKMVRSFKLM